MTHNVLMSNEDENFKKTVKDWLKSIKQDREWLAEQCGVKKTAVDEWFKKRREIPTPSTIIIKQLMDKPVIRDFGNPPGLPDSELKNKLYVNLEPKDQNRLEMQAHLDGMNLSARCSLILEWAADHNHIINDDILAMFAQKWKDSGTRK